MANDPLLLLRSVAEYYTSKVQANGPTAGGVDWNSRESQFLRFAQLAKLFDVSEPFSVIDYGCGYGALAEYLDALGARATYQGFDVSDAMVEEARRLHGADRRFTTLATDLEPADYAVASGIFNVRLTFGTDEWEEYVFATLDELARLGRKGFAFNALTSYSDADRMRADLYYADPCRLFDHCKRAYSRNVALLHDYGLYEFTMLVRL